MTETDGISITLWGSTSAGKTTALAAYIAACGPAWLAADPATEANGDARTLRKTWFELKANRLVEGTAKGLDYCFGHVDGHRVTFRDVDGGTTIRAEPGSDELNRLRTATAVLLFIDMTTMALREPLQSVENALSERRDIPAAVVLTKCECVMSAAEFGPFALDPLKKSHVGEAVLPMQLLERFEKRIFPITVYGWNDGGPAQYLDEFGRVVPADVSPALVKAPFDFAVNALGAK
jgi:hypothetical protein